MLSAQQDKAVKSTDKIILVAAAAGSGKAQPYNTIVPTPKGKKKLGDLNIGDYVFDRKGNPTQILGVYPQGEIDSYKITLRDGRTTFCGKEHIWTCVNRKTGKFYDITVEEMLNKSIQCNNREYRYKIPMNQAIEFSEKKYEIDPYIIGVFLGDGCCTEYLTFSSDDEEIVMEISKLIGATEYYSAGDNFSWCFKQEKYFNEETKRERTRFHTKTFFHNYLNEIVQLSKDKRIPEEYKNGSISQRLDLLQGLMDTDGSIYSAENRYTTRFTNTSLTLITDIQEILWSLGYQSTISSDIRAKYKEGICYSLNILIENEEKYKLFRLSRKKKIAELAKNYIKRRNYNYISISNIEKMEQKENMLCINVDNNEHLYLTNDYIVTHNTRVIVEHIKFLMESGVDPSKIYAITYTNSAAQEMLERLNDAPVFIGTIHSLANKILRNSGINTSEWIEEQAFDKLLERINEDYYNEIELPEIEHLLVDEFQDVCDDEANFIQYSLRAKHIFVVGDSCQCQPAGTKVLLKTGERKNIEDIIVGDKVAGSNIHDSARITNCGKYAKGYQVLKTARHLYFKDYLYTITTEEGFISSYTSNHKHYIRMKESEYHYVVYLMKNSKNQFRIGKTKLYSETQGQLGIRLRMIQEKCTDCWIIDVFKTEKEALLKEIELSSIYGIPQIIFDYNKLQFSEEDIDNIYSKIDSEYRASLCLKDNKKNIDYPFLSKNDNQHFSRNASVEIYACNIFKEIMDVITYDETNLENKRKISSIIDLSTLFIEEPIEVYSLDVDKVHNYIADEILTHNSIYGFKGANYHRFIDLARNKGTTLFKLETNYRNGSSILNRGNIYLRNMDDVYKVNSVTDPKNGQGEVSEEEYSLPAIAEYVSEGNFGDWFILGRTNAQVSDILEYLKRKNIPCTTFKKSEKTYLELKDEFKNNTVKVLTIHSAKGLEAKNVIVVGLQLFNAEENRVAYVACTRAKQRLIIMYTPKPARGKRRQMNMYDDAVGNVIDFTKLANTNYNYGGF